MVCGQLACTDRNVLPLSSPAPLSYRLKTTNNVKSQSSPFSTEYTFDLTNRVTSFTTSMGTKAMITYDGQNRYERLNYSYRLADDTNGEIIRFAYNSNDNDFTQNTSFIKNGNPNGTLLSATYKFDAKKRLVSMVKDGSVETYRYTGDNITRVDYIANGYTSTTMYEYDDKLNPYYGLIAPDIGAIRRFSRNNSTKIINGTAAIEYVYQYNAQGLPIKITKNDGTLEVLLTYESY